MRNRLEVNFQTEDAEMERIWQKHIAPQFEGEEFAQRQLVEDLWNDETISDNDLVSCLMKVGGIAQDIQNRNLMKRLAQSLGGL